MSEPTPDATTTPKPEPKITITIVHAAPEAEPPRPRLLPCHRCGRVVAWPYIHTCDGGAGAERA